MTLAAMNRASKNDVTVQVLKTRDLMMMMMNSRGVELHPVYQPGFFLRVCIIQ
jgi:hypothetical protein